MKKPDDEVTRKGKMAKTILDALSDETKEAMIKMSIKDGSELCRQLAVLHALGYRGHTMVATRAADGAKFKLKVTIEEVE